MMEKQGSDCAHLWIKFFIQNVILRVSRRKNSKMFSFFLVFFFAEMFIEVP